MSMRILSTALLIAIALVSNASYSSANGQSANPFSKLAGSWKGGGAVRFNGGQSERLTCRGYYTVKGDGNQMGLALRCASAGAKIHLRSQLTFRNGRISGQWEERTFNAVGAASGRANDTSMNLAIRGGGLKGSMALTFGKSSQSVQIKTSGAGLDGIFLKLVRG